MIVFINVIGLLLIGLIIWWFWLSTPKVRHEQSGEEVVIKVDGGVYSPAVIEMKGIQHITLSFYRTDPDPCAEQVVFPQLGVVEELPLNQEVSINLDVPGAGEYEFTCQKAMYRGKLLIT